MEAKLRTGRGDLMVGGTEIPLEASPAQRDRQRNPVCRLSMYSRNTGSRFQVSPLGCAGDDSNPTEDRLAVERYSMAEAFHRPGGAHTSQR